MGGGDVKLFAALALWFHWIDVIRLILGVIILPIPT
jgi:Flp pilus assembly protein protease CpaA